MSTWEERMAARAHAKQKDYEAVQDREWEEQVREAAPIIESLISEMDRPSLEEAHEWVNRKWGCACIGALGPLRGLAGAPCGCQVQDRLCQEVLNPSS